MVDKALHRKKLRNANPTKNARVIIVLEYLAYFVLEYLAYFVSEYFAYSRTLMKLLNMYIHLCNLDKYVE